MAVAAILGAAHADAAQLTLTWTDTSGGQANFMIERKAGNGTYAQYALQYAGIPSYVDSNVAIGTTYCYRVVSFTSVANSFYSNEACGTPASTPASTLSVSVQKSGTGTGTVVSTPAGVNCGSTCASAFQVSSVTLTATPAAGSSFTGWSGGGCSGTAACTVAGNGSVAVTANFTPTTATSTSYTLTVSKKGSGGVLSSTGSIICGSACSTTQPSGTVVTLFALAGLGTHFEGWSGACSGKSSSCKVTLTRSTSVAATFR